jgi:hypothetical protein
MRSNQRNRKTATAAIITPKCIITAVVESQPAAQKCDAVSRYPHVEEFDLGTLPAPVKRN